ncbi:MAG TPA: alpha/beta hydrolase [Magnetospirillum sp.]|nr:alpha/beta hydrolase [Magnetospirillum sp.]
MDVLEVDGARLECQWVGPENDGGPVLVFLHEGLGSVSLWRDFPAQVAAATGLRAFVYSRQGYGGSSPVPLPRPLDYLEREARDVLPRLLDAAGIRSAILVGHSDGATIALVHAALDRSGRVKAVAALAPHTFVEDMCVAAIAEVRKTYAETRCHQFDDQRRAIAEVRKTYAETLRPRLVRHHGDNVDCAFWGWNGAWLDPGFKAMEFRPLLSSIAVPVVVIQGEDDEYATAAQVDAVTAGVRGPVEGLMLAACGHAPHRDQPEAVIAAISRLITPLSA